MDGKKEMYVNLGIEMKGNERKHTEIRTELRNGRVTDALFAYGVLGQTLIKRLDIPVEALIAAIMAAEDLVGAENA